MVDSTVCECLKIILKVAIKMGKLYQFKGMFIKIIWCDCFISNHFDWWVQQQVCLDFYGLSYFLKLIPTAMKSLSMSQKVKTLQEFVHYKDVLVKQIRNWHLPKTQHYIYKLTT